MLQISVFAILLASKFELFSRTLKLNLSELKVQAGEVNKLRYLQKVAFPNFLNYGAIKITGAN